MLDWDWRTMEVLCKSRSLCLSYEVWPGQWGHDAGSPADTLSPDNWFSRPVLISCPTARNRSGLALCKIGRLWRSSILAGTRELATNIGLVVITRNNWAHLSSILFVISMMALALLASSICSYFRNFFRDKFIYWLLWWWLHFIIVWG